MKMLFTSTGIVNEKIAEALTAMTEKPRADVRIGFIPTAANVEPGNKADKDWFVRQFVRLHEFGFIWIDVIDISAPEVNWKDRLAAVDVIVMSGGNTFHLLDQARKTGFDTWLTEYIKEKVYVGISAGSILVTPSIAVANVEPGDENLVGLTDMTGLNLVPFEVSPHSPESVSIKANQSYFGTIQNSFYTIDESSALQYINGEITFVGNGCKKY